MPIHNLPDGFVPDGKSSCYTTTSTTKIGKQQANFVNSNPAAHWEHAWIELMKEYGELADVVRDLRESLMTHEHCVSCDECRQFLAKAEVLVGEHFKPKGA